MISFLFVLFVLSGESSVLSFDSFPLFRYVFVLSFRLGGIYLVWGEYLLVLSLISLSLYVVFLSGGFFLLSF